MKIKVTSSSPKVSIVGLGVVETNKVVTVSKAQADNFERMQGITLADAGYVVKEETKSTKEAK